MQWCRRRPVARQIAEAREALACAEEAAGFGTWCFDPGGRQLMLSREAERICGVPHETQGHALDDFLLLSHPADRDALAATFAVPAEHGDASEAALRLRRPGDGMVHLIIRGRRSGKRAFGVMVDVSALRAAEDRLRDADISAWHATMALREVAQEDELTGLCNRRRLDRLLVQEYKRAVRSNLPFALMLINFDQFDVYHDCHGQVVADACLRRTADRLRSIPRRSDDVLARYADHEFALLLPLADGQGAHRIALSIRDALRDLAIPHEANGSGLVGVSIGIAVFTGVADIGNPQEMLHRAAQALQQAQAGGGGGIETYDRTMSPADDTPPAGPTQEKLVQHRI
jgi:diguanylate cyclase (GGDEF)-like protein